MKFIKKQLLFIIVDVSASTEAFYGTAMGSPDIAIVADIFMEFLEQSAMASVNQLNANPSCGNAIDDILEVIKQHGVDKKAGKA